MASPPRSPCRPAVGCGLPACAARWASSASPTQAAPQQAEAEPRRVTQVDGTTGGGGLLGTQPRKTTPAKKTRPSALGESVGVSLAPAGQHAVRPWHYHMWWTRVPGFFAAVVLSSGVRSAGIRRVTSSRLGHLASYSRASRPGTGVVRAARDFAAPSAPRTWASLQPLQFVSPTSIRRAIARVGRQYGRFRIWRIYRLKCIIFTGANTYLYIYMHNSCRIVQLYNIVNLK
jgi:hypothetical protein